MRADRRNFLRTAGATIGTASLAPIIVRDAFAQANVIKVAAIHDLSGGLDIYGRPMVDCLNFAVEEINGAGGLLGRQIKLISYDAQSNIQLYTQFATEAATKERVAVVQGGITSASREAIRPVLKRFNTLYFYNTQYEGGVCDRNCFCTGSTPAQNVDKLVPFTLKKFGKKVYTVAADYNYGQITAKWVKKYTQEHGGEVLQTDYFPLEVSDFGPAITKIQAAKPNFVMSVLVFAGIYAIGNPVDILINPQADQAEIARATAALGLDKPLWLQYLIFLGNAFHGDLGRSFVFNQPALQLIVERLPATLELAIAASVLAIVVGIPAGLYAGLRPDGVGAKAITAGSILGFSLPTFWVGLVLIMVFAVQLGWLPSTGRGATVRILGIETSLLTLDGLRHILLPALNLALFKMALVIRLTRAGTREVLPLDYIKFARAKGLSPRRIILVHVLKNIMIPIVTVIGLEFGSVIAFAIVTETVFAWPGMGKLLIDSINLLDRPIIVAYLLVIVFMFIVINLLVDILYSALDPRVRLSDAKG